MTVTHPFARAILLWAPLLATPLGCKPGSSSTPPEVALPSSVDDDMALVDGLNAFALLDESDPRRSALRESLAAYLLDASGEALAASDHDRALGALERTVDLWTPAELRSAGLQSETIARAAMRLYDVAGREGREFPAAFALGVAQAFGNDTTRERATQEWQALADWLDRGRDYPTEFHQPPVEVQDVLEQACAAFPSPWLTEELATIYRAQIPLLRAVDSAGVEDRGVPGRGDFAGFLLVRAYLRADDLDAARDALSTLAAREQTKTFRSLVERATEPSSEAQPLNDLIAYLQPDENSANLPPWLTTQGWGIVDNLSRRALARDASNAHANLARAQSLRQLGLVDAAIVHFERTIAKQEDLFDAWAALAEMYQDRLERDSNRSPDRGTGRLVEIEAFHRQASRLWSDRPIRPGLPDAYLTVATAHYDSGHPERARPLLEKSTALEPLPAALDLLGTIEHRVGALDRAAQHYRALVELPFADQDDRTDWEIQARTQLGLIALERGDAAGAKEELKLALQQLNLVLSQPRLPEGEYSVRLIERYRVLFLLGDIELAMADFRNSVSTTPGQPALYAQSMLLATSHARYDAALEVYRRAMVRREVPDSLKLYFSLWLLDLAERQHREPDTEALIYVRGYRGEPWHVLLARHAQGQATFSDLEAHAENAGHRAEAYFYEGLRQWRLGNDKAAAKLLRQVLSTKMMSFFEYEMAQTYLANDPLRQLDAGAGR